MVEIIENAIQMVVAAGCFTYSIIEVLRIKNRAWIILSLVYAEIFIGNLYWQLYLAFFEAYPQFPFAAEFCWDVALGFLLLLAKGFSRGKISIKNDPILVLIPIFTGVCALFYIRWGQYADNIICAVLMAAIMLRSVESLRSIKGKKQEGERVSASTKKLFTAVLMFCTAEYLSWTASCFFEGDSILNPYIWADSLVTITLVFPITAVKACDKDAYESLPGEE